MGKGKGVRQAKKKEGTGTSTCSDGYAGSNGTAAMVLSKARMSSNL